MRRQEQAFQITVCDFIDRAYPQLMYWHVPNAAKRGFAAQAAFKRMGGLSGVPDLCMILPNGKAGFLELKAPKGRLSKAQSEFGEKAVAAGAQWVCVDSLVAVETILHRWLSPWGWKAKARIAA